MAVARLLNDYIFICLILYGKPVELLSTSVFLLLPLVNNLNHSGKKKTGPISLRLYILIFGSYYFLNDFKFSVSFIFPVIVISMINGLIFLRLYLMNFANNLYSIIEEFYQDNLNIGKTHVILKEVVKRHKNNKLVYNSLPVENIILFRLKENGELKILLSSKFVVNFKLLNYKDFAKEILETQYTRNNGVALDNRISNNNLFILKEHNNINYVFFVEFSRKPPLSLTLNIYIDKVLMPLLTKITKVAYAEYQLELENKNYFQEVKSRLENIDSAVNAIHYLNNKLSPVLNYFEMLRLQPSVEKEKRVAFDDLIEREKRNAISSIIPITQKMNQMAEKTMNANIISETQKFSLRKVFALIRKSCDENNNIRFEYNVNWDENIFSKIVVSNINLLSFIIDEVIINIEKHSTGICEINYGLEDLPTISFCNEVKNLEKNRASLNKIIEDFNKDNINEIMKRGSNGLRIIKQYLLQLNIGHKMSLSNDKLILTLTLKLDDESSNI